MAIRKRKHSENVPGNFFVDSQCIDCDLCRQTAPKNFKRSLYGGQSHSYIARQPASLFEENLCRRAMQDCPVEAIGLEERYVKVPAREMELV